MNKEQKVANINMLIRGIAIITAMKEDSGSQEVKERSDKLLSDFDDMLVVLVMTDSYPSHFEEALKRVEDTINEIENYTQSL